MPPIDFSSWPLPATLKQSADETKVQYVQLGSCGLRVSFPILGAMLMGSAQQMPGAIDQEPAMEVLKAAFDRGINTWDTANGYGNGLSERVIAETIRKYNIPRHKLIIMTKCFFPVGETPDIFSPAHGGLMAKSKDYVNQSGLSRAAIFNAVDASLERLGTSYIDVLQIHRYDASVAPEETMKALHDLVQGGKVRYLGASSMRATQFARLQSAAEARGWTRFVSMQNYYHLCYREEERDMNRYCAETGVGLVPWSPIYRGLLARPLGADYHSARSRAPNPVAPGVTPADEEIIHRVETLAGGKGWKMVEVALLWHKSKGTIPIIGLNSVPRIEEMCGLREKSLTEEEIRYLEEPYVAKAVAGHD
ncbi:NADP-dependent oxidoreductase domain-containing protein [Xylariomycetidae sp. FL0641]|nr:NADP-dependent oxidoreductase domain-containing protein [Xylariomycetidae sp. FL0641]